MGFQGVVPSTLVRALQRFAVREDGASGSSAHVSRGLLLGLSNNATSGEKGVTVFGILRDSGDCEAVLPHLPDGISPVGSFLVWVTGGSSLSEEDEVSQAAALVKKHADASVAPVTLVYVHESKRLHLFDASSSTPQPLEILDCPHASDFIAATESLLLRSSTSFQASSREELSKLRQELEKDRSTSLFFQFPEDSKAIFNTRGVDMAAKATAEPLALASLVKIPEKRAAETATSSNKAKKNKAKAMYDAWETTKELFDGKVIAKNNNFLSSEPDSSGASPSYLKTLEYGDIAHVELLQSMAFTTLLEKTVTVPTVEIPSSNSTKATAIARTTLIHVDALVVVPQSASVAEAVGALRAELIKQIKRLEVLWTPTVAKLQSHHFGLIGAAFPVTLPATNGDLSLSKEAATAVADSLLQPPSRPLFDPARSSLLMKAAVLADINVLFNVHEGIPSSGVPNGTQYLVDGFYGYYHYMQQAMNDKGWGCAYRSLQTLASWLFWNQYTQSPTLSHREIQQTLVKIGDKPAAFVGSRDWIGSMEVGFVLDEVFGVSFRTLNVSSGPELVEKAQELKHHFETQGTPVMMGGGQLAFTLLGIDYNASSGDCAFLILDPHYVGTEDLATIQTKTIPLEGYKAIPCGWRKASTFAKNSFYNLCLPQRPLE